MPLPEVLRLLVGSNQTGALNIVRPGSPEVVASLYIQLGQLVEASTNEYNGLDAIKYCARLLTQNLLLRKGPLLKQTLFLLLIPQFLSMSLVLRSARSRLSKSPFPV